MFNRVLFLMLVRLEVVKVGNSISVGFIYLLVEV